MMSDTFVLPPFISLLCARRSIIEEALFCYENGKYSATVCTLLPVVEGLLWDYSIWVDSKIARVYDTTGKSIVAEGTGKIVQNPTIGDLLRKTALGREFYTEFVEYFCSELYTERCPVLHGTECGYGTKPNAARKIGTVEYLLSTMANRIREWFFKICDRVIPAETIDRMLTSKVE